MQIYPTCNELGKVAILETEIPSRYSTKNTSVLNKKGIPYELFLSSTGISFADIASYIQYLIIYNYRMNKIMFSQIYHSLTEHALTLILHLYFH